MCQEAAQQDGTVAYTTVGTAECFRAAEEVNTAPGRG